MKPAIRARVAERLAAFMMESAKVFVKLTDAGANEAMQAAIVVVPEASIFMLLLPTAKAALLSKNAELSEVERRVEPVSAVRTLPSEFFAIASITVQQFKATVVREVVSDVTDDPLLVV
jgi:hypothetical protein